LCLIGSAAAAGAPDRMIVVPNVAPREQLDAALAAFTIMAG
jgi:hypothetical protein